MIITNKTFKIIKVSIIATIFLVAAIAVGVSIL